MYFRLVRRDMGLGNATVSPPVSAVPGAGVSQLGNKWLLGVLVGIFLLCGLDRYLKRPRPNPEEKDAERRAAMLKTWTPAFRLGTVAADFHLPDAQGRQHSLSEFLNKPTLLSFYSDDKRSRVWAREMQKLWGHIGRSRMRSVVVVNFSLEQAAEFIRDTKDQSVYLFESPDRHPVRDQYAAAPGPNSWVVDRKGRVRHASPPILTDRNPDQDFNGVYHALQALAPARRGPSDVPTWAAGQQRPPADE